MSKANQNYCTVDIFSIARNRQKINTTVAVSEMPELAGMIVDADACPPFEVQIEGTDGIKGLPAAILTVKGSVQMHCTRCTKPVEIEIDREVPFLFVKSEAEANRLPVDEDEEWEVVVGSEHLKVADWVQEEVILSLPTFPKHEDCEAPYSDHLQADMQEAVKEKPKPFANLRELLKKN